MAQSEGRGRGDHLGHGEACEEALKVVAACELAEASTQLGLGSARGSEVEDVLSAEGGKEQQTDLRGWRG